VGIQRPAQLVHIQDGLIAILHGAAVALRAQSLEQQHLEAEQIIAVIHIMKAEVIQ